MKTQKLTPELRRMKEIIQLFRQLTPAGKVWVEARLKPEMENARVVRERDADAEADAELDRIFGTPIPPLADVRAMARAAAMNAHNQEPKR